MTASPGRTFPGPTRTGPRQRHLHPFRHLPGSKSAFETLRSTTPVRAGHPGPLNWTSASELLTNSNGQVFISRTPMPGVPDDEGDTWSAIRRRPQHTLQKSAAEPGRGALCRYDQQADTPQR